MEALSDEWVPQTLQQLQKHILGAHLVIEPSRSVKLETTQTSALVVAKWINVLSHCQMNRCLKARKLKNVSSFYYCLS